MALALFQPTPLPDALLGALDGHFGPLGPAGPLLWPAEAALSLPRLPLPGAWRFTLDGARLPQAEAALTWVLPGPGQAVAGRLALSWTPPGLPPWEVAAWTVQALPATGPAALEPALSLAREGRCAAAWGALRGPAASGPPALRAFAALQRLSLAARALRGGCAAEPLPAPPAGWGAVSALARAEALALAPTAPGVAAQLSLAAAFYALQAQDLPAADAASAAGAELAAAAGSRALQASALRYRGLFWQAAGRPRQAAAALRAAEALYARLPDPARLSQARKSLAEALRQSGRYGDALRTILDAPPDPSPQHTADWLHSLGWILIAGRAAGELAAPTALIDRVEALAAAHYLAADQPEWEADTYAHRAWAAWLDADLPQASAHLARWRATLPPTGQDANARFALALEGRLLAARGDCPGAWDRASQVAAADAPGEADWLAQQVAAEALACAGDPAAALTRHQTALERVDAQAGHTDLTTDRGAFLSAQRPLVDAALEAALGLGALELAFALADGVQARVVRGLRTEARLEGLAPADRARWLAARGALEQARGASREALATCDLVGHDHPRCQAKARAAEVRAALDASYAVLDQAAPLAATEGLSVAEVQARLGPGEALILFARVADRVGSFWIDAAGIAAAPSAGDALAPWRARLAATRRLYVVSAGVPEAEALTEARLGDGWLMDQTAVSYLPYAGALPRPGAPAPAAGPALVVADPSSDLPQARAEGRDVAAALPGARLLEGPAAAPEALAAALRAGPAVFHFAGHGVLEPAAPWDAHLRLADGQRLTLADVLTQPGAAPALVVLSGCETGRRLDLGRFDAVGLPAAFLLRGARAVLATTRPIGDGEPQAFLRRFYAEGGAADPAGAFQRAARASAAAGDGSWRAFYLMGG